MQLLPKDIEAKLVRQFKQSPEPKFDEQIVHLKLFGILRAAACTWYITGYDAEDRSLYGYCVVQGPFDTGEIGYVSLTELEEMKTGDGCPLIERDKFWSPVPFGEVRAANDGSARKMVERECTPPPLSPLEAARKAAQNLRRPVDPVKPEPFRADDVDRPGSVQVKRINDAVGSLKHHAHATLETTERGYVVEKYEIQLINAQPPREEFYTEYNAIFARYGGIVTKKNAARLAADLNAAVERVKAMRPNLDRAALEAVPA